MVIVGGTAALPVYAGEREWRLSHRTPMGLARWWRSTLSDWGSSNLAQRRRSQSRVHDWRLRAELFCPSPLQIHPRGTIEPKIIAVSNPYPISYDLSERAISTTTSFGAAARSSWAQADPSARHRASRATQWCPSSSAMTRQFFPRLPQHRHGRPRESHLPQISKAAEEAASRQTECNGQG
jgi:hypothetical protein